jgi:hypothetical protein
MILGVNPLIALGVLASTAATDAAYIRVISSHGVKRT